MSTVPRFKGDKCPTCGTEFITDMCPTQVHRRKLEKARRSRAAKRGWKRRKAIENDPDRDKVRYV
jgi:hypothetical protein